MAIASGTWGTCPWEISDAGELVIGAGTGANLTSYDAAPWYNYAIEITSARCSGVVIAPTQVRSMFYSCMNLTSADLSSFDTSEATNMSNMFYYCTNLTTLDLSSFDTSNVTSMIGTFSNCPGLAKLSLGPLSILSKTTNFPLPPTTSPYTGTWVNKDPWTEAPANLAAWYDGSVPGTYEWKKDTDVPPLYSYLDDLGVLKIRDIVKESFDSLEARIAQLESRP